MSYRAVTGFSFEKSAYISFHVPMNTTFNSLKTGRYDILCKWDMFRDQLLKQWTRLNAREVDEAGPDRMNIAKLIHKRYGIGLKLVENYLNNFERMMPLA